MRLLRKITKNTLKKWKYRDPDNVARPLSGKKRYIFGGRIFIYLFLIWYARAGQLQSEQLDKLLSTSAEDTARDCTLTNYRKRSNHSLQHSRGCIRNSHPTCAFTSYHNYCHCLNRSITSTLEWIIEKWTGKRYLNQQANMINSEQQVSAPRSGAVWNNRSICIIFSPYVTFDTTAMQVLYLPARASLFDNPLLPGHHTVFRFYVQH